MIVVAKTPGLMDIWSLFFWVSLGITYLVTAITVRIWPLNKMSDNYYSDNADPEEVIKEGLFKNAWNSAMVEYKSTNLNSIHKSNRCVRITRSASKNYWLTFFNRILYISSWGRTYGCADLKLGVLVSK